MNVKNKKLLKRSTFGYTYPIFIDNPFFLKSYYSVQQKIAVSYEHFMKMLPMLRNYSILKQEAEAEKIINGLLMKTQEGGRTVMLANGVFTRIAKNLQNFK